MTVTDLIRRFQTYTDDKNGDRWEPEEALTLLNDGQELVQEVIDAADEKYFSSAALYEVTTTDDCLEFDLPSDFLRVILVEKYAANNTPVSAIPVNFSDRHKWIPDNTETVSSGFVEYPRYYFRGNKIGVVWPRSSYTLRVHYTKKLADFDAYTDESEIPKPYHKLIALTAAKLAYASEGMDFAPWEDEYKDQVSKLQSYIERRQRQLPRYVNYTRDYVW